MRIAQFTALFLVLLLIILQQADLRIIYKDSFKLRISLTIFAITFFNMGDEGYSLNKTLKLVRNVPLILKSSRFALRRSDVKVFELSQTVKNSSSGSILTAIPIFLSVSSIIAYISANAKSFHIPTSYNDSSNDDLTVDILFKTRVLDLIISALLFLYYTVKRKLRRAIKNV